MTAPSRLRARLPLALAPALVLVTAAGAGAQVTGLVAAARGFAAPAVDTASVLDDGRGPVAGVLLAPRGREPGRAVDGATLSAALVVTNTGRSAATLRPAVTVPAGWTVVTGATPFTLAPGETDPWIVAVRIPTSAAAGDYVIPVAARVGDAGTLHDSLRVTVPERRALGVEVARRPDYVIAGRPFDLEFVVANRGNAPVRVSLDATSSAGGPATADARVVELAVGERRRTAVRAVAGPVASVGGASDDLVELAVADVAHDSVRATATAAVTRVSKPGERLARFTTMPAQLRLRAPGAGVAVSYAELSGGGVVGGGDASAPAPASVDFLLRAPVREVTGGSPFAERDEYRLRVRTPKLDVHLGDGFQTLSPLTGGGLPAFGARLDVHGGSLGAGAYAQRARWSPIGEEERGGYVTARGKDVELSAQFVERGGGSTAGRVGSVRGVLRASEAARVSVEIAHGADDRGAGLAVDARLAGRLGPLSYDAGHMDAPRSFGGPLRGSANDFVSANLHIAAALQVHANATTQRNDLGMVGFPASFGFEERGVGATVFDRVTVTAERSERSESFGAYRLEGSQEVLRVRALQPVGRATLTASAATGTAVNRTTDVRAAFHGWGVAADLPLRGGQRVGAFVDVDDGRALTRRGPATLLVGVQGDAALPLGATLRLTSSGTRMRDGGGWRLWTDATVERRMRSGDAIRLHVRQLAQPSAPMGGFGQPHYYVEYARALRIPAGLARQQGAVRGRVTDVATGRGVAGALVRLGDRAAVTDDRGWATFVGLAPGQHALRLAATAGVAGAIVAGDQYVRVGDRADERGAVRFAVEVARAARVRATVRRMDVARTGLAGAPDSLVDVGGAEGVLLLLVSDRDTLARRTDAAGVADFGDVVPGPWVVRLAGAPGAGLRAEPARADVHAVAGVSHEVALRLLPRAMAVASMLDAEVEIPVVIATSAGSRATRGRVADATTAPAAARSGPVDARAPAVVESAGASGAGSTPVAPTGSVSPAVAAADGAPAGRGRQPRDLRLLLAVLLAAFALAIVARRLARPRR